MKINAQHLLPLVLDFAGDYLSEGDFKVLLKQLTKDSQDTSENYKKDMLVKKGGLKKILECYFTHNKSVYK